MVNLYEDINGKIYHGLQYKLWQNMMVNIPKEIRDKMNIGPFRNISSNVNNNIEIYE